MPAEPGTGIAASLIDGLRATFLRRPLANVATIGAGAFVALVAFYLLVESIGAWIEAPAPRMFVAYGVVTVLADALLTLVAAWVLTRMLGRERIIWGVAAILLAATTLTARLVHWPLQVAMDRVFAEGHVGVAMGLGWLSRGWWLFVLFVVARWLAPRSPGRVLCAAVLAFGVSAATWWWLPGMPLFVQDARAVAAQSAAALAESVADAEGDAEVEPAFDAEHVLYDQPRLLQEAFARLQPRTPGRSNLYVLAFAGDGSENVFHNEVEYVERLFSARFGAGGHTLVLANNPAMLASRPLATLTNLRLALDAIADRMDPANDILLVYLTTHGSDDHQLYVNLEPLPLNQITPEDLADALQTTPSMRWKVLVVNACYAGGFVDALRDDSTLVIAAARSDRASFGCGSESDITFFGRAFLAEALNQTTSIPEAFVLARNSVARWEAEQAVEEHSEPQIATSRSIEAKLERWSAGLDAAAPVPFAPGMRDVEVTGSDARQPPAE